jgi:hypothetical protein
VTKHGEWLAQALPQTWTAKGGQVSPADPGVVTGSRSVNRPAGVRVPPGVGPAGDPRHRADFEDAPRYPPAGQPGHGEIAILRRQPARMVEGRVEGGYTGLFELICCDCGDHPYLDYSEVPPRLQWLRGPRTLQAGLAAYEKHLGLPRTA